MSEPRGAWSATPVRVRPAGRHAGRHAGAAVRLRAVGPSGSASVAPSVSPSVSSCVPAPVPMPAWPAVLASVSTSRQHGRSSGVCVAEQGAEFLSLGFDAAGGSDGDGTVGGYRGDVVEPAGSVGGVSDEVLGALESVVASVAAIDFGSLSDGELRTLLRRISLPLRQLSAFRTRGAGELDVRAVAGVRPERVERARQDNRRQLRDEWDITPSEAKQATQTGSRLQQLPQADREYSAGRLSDAHARVITDTLAYVPADLRSEVEARLVGLAGQMDAIAFGRTARRVLAEVDIRAAQDRERLQHQRRFVKVADGEDGSVYLSARLYGLQAEKLRTALDAFTLPDPTSRGRSFEQRAADGFESLLDAALQSGRAPSQHGIRPHVLVIVEYTQLALAAGIAELGFTGPITMEALRPLLSDCTVSRIVMGPDSVPIEAGGSVRTVPAGLWRALVARDGGCTWQRCDAPPSWCDVAHGHIPFRDNGGLSLENAALLCRRHHRRFDHGPWRIDIHGPDVTYTRTDNPRAQPG